MEKIKVKENKVRKRVLEEMFEIQMEKRETEERKKQKKLLTVNMERGVKKREIHNWDNGILRLSVS